MEPVLIDRELPAHRFQPPVSGRIQAAGYCMRIDNSNRTGAGTGVRTERTRKTDRAKALLSRRAPDTLSIMDIPPNELTPKVREAIMTLMAEVDHLRQEIEEQRARVSNLERLADQDPLTPLVNRRAFVRELSRIVSFSERYGTPASLVFFGMNGLKAINDTYGHAAGDAALQRVAVLLMDNIRESDLVGRLGGDEFGVLLAHADEAAAMEKAHQLIDTIEAQPLVWEGAEIPVTLAYGSYTFKGGEDANATIAAADKAMYARKNASKEAVSG